MISVVYDCLSNGLLRRVSEESSCGNVDEDVVSLVSWIGREVVVRQRIFAATRREQSPGNQRYGLQAREFWADHKSGN